MLSGWRNNVIRTHPDGAGRTGHRGTTMAKTKCWYGGHVLAEMCYANFYRADIAQHENPKPEKCRGCEAMRTPIWVKRSLGGRGSGCWQWSEVYPHHTTVVA